MLAIGRNENRATAGAPVPGATTEPRRCEQAANDGLSVRKCFEEESLPPGESIATPEQNRAIADMAGFKMGTAVRARADALAFHDSYLLVSLRID